MTRFPLLCLVLYCCLGVLPSCASTGGSARGTSAASPVSVTFRDYRSGVRLTIVNDGYLVKMGIKGENADLRRAAYHSSEDVDLWTKILPDEVMDGLISGLDQEGFREHAQSGPAPRETARSSGLTSGLEMIVGGNASHWNYNPSWSITSPPAEANRYKKARDGFLDVHRKIEQYARGGVQDFDYDGVPIRERR
ncbi:MAG: hypothetical protein O2816_07305 [Planctomycetota bacterium]|nr:hypothetical protein [Planctomycetota bacterium]